MTRPERKQTRPSSSSKPKSSNPFAAFEFTNCDAEAEKTDAKNVKKFGTNNMKKIKKKKKKPEFVSPLTKYKFLQFFTRDDAASKKEVDREPIDVDAEGDGASKEEVDCEPVDVDGEVKEDGNISKTELHCEIVDLDVSGGGVAYRDVVRESADFDRKEATERDDLFLSTSNYRMEPSGTTLDNKKGSIGMQSSSPSIYIDLDTEVPSEERAPVYNDGGRRIDNTNNAVVVYPDIIFCGVSNYKKSRLIFSTSSVNLEGSSLSGTGTPVNFEWTLNEIASIESTWCERVKTAIVNLHFKLKDPKGDGITKGKSGIKGLKFAVYDPHWSERQKAIKSLGLVYKGTWREIFDLDAEEDEDSLGGYNPMFFSGHQHTNSKEHLEVIYPEGKPEAVTIRGRDVELLRPETFINDNIIDFYIQYLKNKIPPEGKHRFYFFNCFFFKKLVGLDNNPSTVGKEREAFQRVRKWTKNVNLFEMDYIFIPVNYSLHWSLIVICHPGEVACLKDREIENLPRVPCILHMDSIRGSHRGLRNPVQSYLCELWKETHGTSAEDVASEYPQIPFVELELPQQENSFDCGIFLLHYVEKFLEEAPDTFSPFAVPKSRNFLKRNWFLPEEASLKRAHIHELIYYIHGSYSQKGSLANRCRSYHSPQAMNTNKVGSESKSPEKRNILTETCGGNSVSDAEHEKENSIIGAGHRSVKFGNDSPGVLDPRTRKKPCFVEDHERKTAVDSKSNSILHNEEAEEPGMQVFESTTEAADCEIIAYSSQYLNRGISGKESPHHQGFSVHFDDSDDDISYSGTSLNGFQSGDPPLQKADEMKLERTEELGCSPAGEELAKRVVQDSQDEDHMEDGSETKSSISLFRVTSCPPPHKENVSLDIIDLTEDCMLSS